MCGRGEDEDTDGHDDTTTTITIAIRLFVVICEGAILIDQPRRMNKLVSMVLMIGVPPVRSSGILTTAKKKKRRRRRSYL